MIQFSWGALTMACAIIGLFLLKFWRQTSDRLFIFFAVAFWTLGLHWFLLAYVNPGVESRHELYLLRLAAFTLIIVGVVDKNVRAAKLARANGKGA